MSHVETAIFALGFILVVLAFPGAVATFAWCNNRDIYDWRCLVAGSVVALAIFAAGSALMVWS